MARSDREPDIQLGPPPRLLGAMQHAVHRDRKALSWWAIAGLMIGSALLQQALPTLLALNASSLLGYTGVYVWGVRIDEPHWLFDLPPLSLVGLGTYRPLSPAETVWGPLTHYVLPLYAAWLAQRRRRRSAAPWRSWLSTRGTWMRATSLGFVLGGRVTALMAGPLVVVWLFLPHIALDWGFYLWEPSYLAVGDWVGVVLWTGGPSVAATCGAAIGFSSARPVRFAAVVFLLLPVAASALQRAAMWLPLPYAASVMAYPAAYAVLAVFLAAHLARPDGPQPPTDAR